MPNTPSKEPVHVFCAGQFDGDGVYGWLVVQGNATLFEYSSVILDPQNEHLPEYAAAASALGWLLAAGYAGNKIVLHCDSQALVKQLTRRQRPPRNISGAHRRAAQLLRKFRDLTFIQIPEWRNKRAIALTQQAFNSLSNLPSNTRERKAKQLSETIIALGDNRFRVASQSSPSAGYIVDLGKNTCTCRDFAIRGRRIGYCKHILAAQMHKEAV